MLSFIEYNLLHSNTLSSNFPFSAINPILYNAMSDRFRKAFRSLLVCRDGSTRSEQRLCMTGQTGFNTNNIDRASCDPHLNTKNTRLENASNSVTPCMNLRSTVKRNETMGSGVTLQKAAAEAAAKNNLASASILVCTTYSTQGEKQEKANILGELNPGNGKIYNRDEKCPNPDIVQEDPETLTTSTSEISNPQNQDKRSHRHHHHHHHHRHHHSHHYKYTNQDSLKRSNNGDCQTQTIQSNISVTEKCSSMLHNKEYECTVKRSATSCSMESSATVYGNTHCSKEKNISESTKVTKTFSAPNEIPASITSSSWKGDIFSNKAKSDASGLNPRSSDEQGIENNDEDGEEHQILVKLSGACQQSMCQIYNEKNNRLLKNIAIIDTKVQTGGCSLRRDGSNLNDIDHVIVNNIGEEAMIDGEKDLEYSKISSSPSSSKLGFENINISSKIEKEKPLSVKRGLPKKQWSNYITELSYSTAL